MDPQLKNEIVLQDGVDLRTIMTTGSTFSVTVIDSEEDAPIDSAQHASAFISALSLNESESCFTTNDFAALALEMVDVREDGYVKKKVLSCGGGHLVPKNASIKAFYAGFWEKEKYPFDWKLNGRPRIFNLGADDLLLGLQNAVCSMEFGERSVFLLSYQVMYGELGVPPRIRGKETCLFYVHVLGLADNKFIKQSEERDMFTWSHRVAAQHYTNGKVLSDNKNYKQAAIMFEKAVEILQTSRLTDADEEEKQRSILKKLYLCMAICYNKMNLPKKACLACNNLHRLESLWNNHKALFQNACALIMLEEYTDAEKRLKRALKLKPNCKVILEQIQMLNKKMEKRAKRNSHITTISLECKDKKIISKEFIETVKSMCEDFANNPDTSRLSLPSGLSKAELDVVQEIGLKYGFTFARVVSGDKTHLDKQINGDECYEEELE